jgi:hypothetical protein
MSHKTLIVQYCLSWIAHRFHSSSIQIFSLELCKHITDFYIRFEVSTEARLTLWYSELWHCVIWCVVAKVPPEVVRSLDIII